MTRANSNSDNHAPSCEGRQPDKHDWNLIPGIGEIDLTREQFPANYALPRGVEVQRSRLLEGERAIAARTPERYALLKKRVHDDIRSNHDPEW